MIVASSVFGVPIFARLVRGSALAAKERALAVLGFNLLGDGRRDVLDPTLRD